MIPDDPCSFVSIFPSSVPDDNSQSTLLVRSEIVAPQDRDGNSLCVQCSTTCRHQLVTPKGKQTRALGMWN